ncbi:hypothetical protein [Aquabacterium sp. OR-4]|uniref:hypothetical protein n=1 Tax=Aquabacterium sp. OR-4 TaxID=2978127 RepID=UPI0028C8A29D|nr:hypothetical protein [Aquabacterium sp. OR-4]MDT7838949.1 hypothetical protein [Aquabacterium sp. OR-4]
MSGFVATLPGLLQRALRWRWPIHLPIHLHWRRPGVLPGAAGCLALLVAAWLALLLAPRWRAEAAVAGQALTLRARQAQPAATVPPPPGPAQRLHEALPPAALAAQRLTGLLALAQRHGLAVGSVHQAPLLRGDGLHSVPMVWRAQGRYADVRGFVAAALQADPALVLEQMRLGRAGPAAAMLEVDLHWQMLQRAAMAPDGVAGTGVAP